MKTRYFRPWVRGGIPALLPSRLSPAREPGLGCIPPPDVRQAAPSLADTLPNEAWPLLLGGRAVARGRKWRASPTAERRAAGEQSVRTRAPQLCLQGDVAAGLGSEGNREKGRGDVVLCRVSLDGVRLQAAAEGRLRRWTSLTPAAEPGPQPALPSRGSFWHGWGMTVRAIWGSLGGGLLGSSKRADPGQEDL